MAIKIKARYEIRPILETGTSQMSGQPAVLAQKPKKRERGADDGEAEPKSESFPDLNEKQVKVLVDHLTAHLNRVVKATEENADDYNRKKQKLQKRSGVSRSSFFFSLFGHGGDGDSDDDEDEDSSRSTQSRLLEILSDIAVDSVSEETIDAKFDDLDPEAHKLTKWTYQIAYPKELDKVRVQMLSRVPNIVRLQIEESGEPLRFNLCVFGTTDQKIANRYRAQDLSIEASRNPDTKFGSDAFIRWIGKYFPDTKYDAGLATKKSYSKTGTPLQTCFIFVPLPVTAAEINSFVSPVWIHDIKITATKNADQVMMAITSFADT